MKTDKSNEVIKSVISAMLPIDCHGGHFYHFHLVLLLVLDLLFSFRDFLHVDIALAASIDVHSYAVCDCEFLTMMECFLFFALYVLNSAITVLLCDIIVCCNQQSICV